MKKLILLLISSIMVFSCGGSGTQSNNIDDFPEQENPGESLNKPDPTIGLAILALLNKNFPLNDAIELLSMSDRPTFSFLYGTFGDNSDNYNDLMNTLISQEKHPVVGIYGICGPCRAPRRDGSLVKFRPDVDIDKFNELMTYDPDFQEQYRLYINHIKVNFIDNYPEIEFDFYPELESNMNESASRSAYNILVDLFQNNPNVKIVTNPLNNERLDNIPMEIHTNSIENLDLLKKGDYISFDGTYFLFPEETNQGVYLDMEPVSFDDIKTFIIEAKSRGYIVYLWRPEWQGLKPNPPSPDQRVYEFRYKNKIIELLKL